MNDQFDNHGACRFWQRDRYVNDAVFGDSLRRSQLADGTIRDHWTDGPLNVSTASFHPSSKGYDAYLDAARRQRRRSPRRHVHPLTSPPPAPPPER